jgi:hypothetical protein
VTSELLYRMALGCKRQRAGACPGAESKLTHVCHAHAIRSATHPYALQVWLGSGTEQHYVAQMWCVAADSHTTTLVDSPPLPAPPPIARTQLASLLTHTQEYRPHAVLGMVLCSWTFQRSGDVHTQPTCSLPGSARRAGGVGWGVSFAAPTFAHGL